MLSHSLHRVPFTRRGAWWGLSRLPKERATELGKSPGLFLRTYRGNVPMEQREVMRIEFLPLKGEKPLVVVDHFAGGKIHFQSPRNSQIWAESVFSDNQTIRWQGTGCRLRLVATATSYDYARPAGQDHWELNLFSARIQIMLSRIAGRVTVEAPWKEQRSLHIIIEVAPIKPAGHWEIALEEFVAAWQKPARLPSFTACAKATNQEIAAWQKLQPPAPLELEPARAYASYVNWCSLVAPEGHLQREGMLMSKNWMLNIWSWDHCFNALGLLPHQPALAWDQWAIMFDHQHPSGMLPDTLNDRDLIWNFTKPPVHGWALKEMIARGFKPKPAQIEQAVVWLEKWTEWWFAYRDDDHDGMPQYNHGNDSGWDNATIFDVGMPVEGPDLAVFLIIQMEVMAELHTQLGHKPNADKWLERADSLFRLLLKHSWDSQRGVFTAPRSGDHLTTEGYSLVALMPLLLGQRLPREIRDKLIGELAVSDRYLTSNGLATESVQSPLYRPNGYWRGPIWAPSTLLVIRGLEACGERGLAREIAQRFCRNFARNGSAENFDAVSGQGLCDQAYTWTASVFLVLAHDLTK